MLEDNFVLRCYHFIFDGCYTNEIYSFRYNNYLFGYNNYIYSTKTVQRTGLQLVYIYIVEISHSIVTIEIRIISTPRPLYKLAGC